MHFLFQSTTISPCLVPNYLHKRDTDSCNRGDIETVTKSDDSRLDRTCGNISPGDNLLLQSIPILDDNAIELDSGDMARQSQNDQGSLEAFTGG